MLAELSPALIAEVQDAAKLLVSKQRICILTGAGISAESGIPTFRDKQTGLWENYKAEDLATPEAFSRDPALVWSWYQWRRKLVADKKPNPAQGLGTLATTRKSQPSATNPHHSKCG